MTDDEHDARLATIEYWIAEQIALLSSAPRLSRPAAGESGILADVVAALAATQRNAEKIALLRTGLAWLEGVLQADYAEVPRPPLPDHPWLGPLLADALARFERSWEGSERQQAEPRKP